MQESEAWCSARLVSRAISIFVTYKWYHRKCAGGKDGLICRWYKLITGKDEFDLQHKKWRLWNRNMVSKNNLIINTEKNCYVISFKINAIFFKTANSS
jgi:hypothetical protein